MVGVIARLIPVLALAIGIGLLTFGGWRALQAFNRDKNRGKWIPLIYLGVVAVIVIVAMLTRQ